MKKCIIIGAGAYGQVYLNYLSECYEISGFFDSNHALIGSLIQNYPVLGCVSQVENYMENHRDTAVFVPLGDNNRRVELLSKFEKLGYDLPSFIHKSALINANVVLGKSVYILPSTNIMPYTSVGDYTMISMGVNIAHHVNIATGCFFSQGCNIGASINIEEKTYFGMASAVMTGVKNIGAQSLMGVGTVIIRDVAPKAVMIGNPGKVLKKRVKVV